MASESLSVPESGIISSIPATNPVEDLLQTTPHQNCQRLVVLGSARSGKSSLVARFLNNKFSDSYTPTIENFYRKVYRIRGEVYQLDILDTSGNHPFPAMQRLSFITGDLFLLVFSVDSRESFEEVARLRTQIIETKCHIGGGGTGAGGGSSRGGTSKKGASGLVRPLSGSSFRTKKSHSPNPIPMVIAGNKCDREMRTVTADESASLCSGFPGCRYVETSAKKNWNIDELFRQLFQLADLPPEMAPNSHKRLLLPSQILAAGGGSSVSGGGGGGSSSSNGSSPSHQPPLTSKGSKKGSASKRFRGLSIRRRMSDAYGVVALNARRPSLHTDLLIMKSKTSSAVGGRMGASSASASAGVTPPAHSSRRFAMRCVIQ